MRWSPWLLRVVTEHRPFLMAVERFHRRVDIKNPGFAQQRPGAIVELFLKPGPPSFLLDLAQCPTHCVLAHHLRHPEQRGIDRVHPLGASRPPLDPCSCHCVCTDSPILPTT